MGLIFNKIENGDVFTRDFNPLTRNNQIDFPTTEEIAVIYGPNGTGKTSLRLLRILTAMSRSSTRIPLRLSTKALSRMAMLRRGS